MERQNVVKIDGDEFSCITRARPIKTLKNICIPAVALHVYNLAQTDSSYNVTKFQQLLYELNNHYTIDTSPLIAQLYEKINSYEWQKIKSFITGEKLNLAHLHFSGKKFIFKDEPDQNFTCFAYYANIDDGNYPKFVYPSNPKLIAISTHLLCWNSGNTLYVQDSNSKLSEPSKYNLTHRISALALALQAPECAAGFENGEIYIKINDSKFHKFIQSEHVAPITALYFTPDSILYSSDAEGTILVKTADCYKKLPLKKKIHSIIGSSDNTLIAFRHANDQNAASILNWNTLTITQFELGPLVAFTHCNKILACKNESLSLYNLDGQLLQTYELPQSARLFGNEGPTLSTPSIIMTTEENKESMEMYIENDYSEYPPSYRGPVNTVEKFKKVYITKTTFWIPQIPSIETLFEKLSRVKNQ